MKKILVWGIGTVLAGAGGGLLYTIGAQTETLFTRQVENLQTSPQVELKTSSYQRGVLTSQASQELRVPVPAGSPIPPLLNARHEIQHTLLITPTRIFTRLSPPAQNEPWLELDTHIGLDGQGVSKLHLPARQAPPWQWETGQGEVRFGPDQTEGELFIPSLTWQNARLQGVENDFRIHRETPERITGYFSLQAENVEHESGGAAAVMGENTLLRMNFEFHAGLLDLTVDGNSPRLRLGEDEYHGARLDLSLQNLDVGEAPALFSSALLLGDQPEFLRWMSAWALLERATRLLRSHPVLELRQIVLNTPRGPALEASLHLSGSAPTGTPRLPLQALQQLRASGALRLSDDLLRKFAPAGPQHPMMQSLLQRGYMKYADGVYTTRIEFREGQLNILADESKPMASP